MPSALLDVPHKLVLNGTMKSEGAAWMPAQTESLLVYLGRITVQIPAVQLAVGYLMADTSRVQFVASAEPRGHELFMSISAHRRIEVPMSPWQGYVRGVPVPDPLTWVQAARSSGHASVMVRVSSDDAVLLSLLNPILAPEKAQRERVEVERRMEGLRNELDRALDLYNEVRHLMGVDHERYLELNKFLSLAEQEMQHMGQEMKVLKDRMVPREPEDGSLD